MDYRSMNNMAWATCVSNFPTFPNELQVEDCLVALSAVDLEGPDQRARAMLTTIVFLLWNSDVTAMMMMMTMIMIMIIMIMITIIMMTTTMMIIIIIMIMRRRRRTIMMIVMMIMMIVMIVMIMRRRRRTRSFPSWLETKGILRVSTSCGSIWKSYV